MNQEPSHADPAVPEPSAPASRTFRLGYVPGVTPAKWVGVWRDRLPQVRLELVPLPVLDAARALRADHVDAALMRLPVNTDDLNVIRLYDEVPVVLVPTDHVVSAVDAVAADDLAGETVLHPLDDLLQWEQRPGEPARERPATTADAVELVAANVGLLVVPQSLARLHHRKDVVHRPVTDGPASTVGLAWHVDRTTDLVEEFVGIVRGRTANSSRGRGAAPVEGGGAPGTAGRDEPKVSKATAAKRAAARTAADRKAAAARKAAAKGGARATGRKPGKPGGKRGQR